MGYVAVPYLVGVIAAQGSVHAGDLLLGAGLYLGFIGRILLKDFRDVRGDSLFGKRTFLVRHGRRWTCAFSAACWLSGTVTLLAVRDCSPTFVTAYAAHVAMALVLLRSLSVDLGARRDERLISAVALVGRGAVVTLIAHLSMHDGGWQGVTSGAVIAALTLLTAGHARAMVRLGPAVRRHDRWVRDASTHTDATANSTASDVSTAPPVSADPVNASA
jgi:hypothetical protein